MASDRSSSLYAFIGFLARCLAISAAGGWVTARSVGTWFRILEKPSFNPPDWVFAPVWTTLYVLIALAGWRVWRAGEIWRLRGLMGAPVATAVYATQLALHLGWSFLFFGAREIGLAFVEVLFLFATIAVNLALFRRIDRIAGWLLAYLAWVGFASLLNFALWPLN